jgi:hypothetical protein
LLERLTFARKNFELNPRPASCVVAAYCRTLNPANGSSSMRIGFCARAGLLTALFFIAPAFGARAQSPQPAAKTSAQIIADEFHEAESKYMFGFTDGADIGNEGEKALEYESTGSFTKRGGRYSAIEHELAFEHVLTQNFAYELSAHGLSHSINNVEDLDNRNGSQFSGLSAKLRYLILGRGPGSPIGLTVSAEPEWSRIDGADGSKTRIYASVFKVVADTELIPNRLYAALNLIYEPEVAKPAGGDMWERSSSAGVSMGLAYRITPKFVLGVGAEYNRAYEGLAFKTFDGNALFVGPTLQVNLGPKMLLAAAFSGQVAGHAVDDPRALDLTNFEKYRANLKLEIEF